MTKQLLMSSSFWVLNKTVVRALGIETAFLLSNMVEAESIMADEKGWFYQTIETVEEITGLSRHSQGKALKQMIKLGIVEQVNRGIPMKRYFKINYENLSKLLCKSTTTKYAKISHTSVRESDKLDCKISAGNKESNIKKVNKESNNKQLLQQEKKESSRSSSQTEKTSNTNEGPEIDENLALIAKEYERCGFGTIDFRTKELLEDLLEQYSTEWIVQAFTKCVEANKRTLGYTKGILSNWKTEGGMKLGGGDGGGTKPSSRESERELECEGDRLHKRAIELYGDKLDEELDFDF